MQLSIRCSVDAVVYCDGVFFFFPSSQSLIPMLIFHQSQSIKSGQQKKPDFFQMGRGWRSCQTGREQNLKNAKYADYLANLSGN
jgi:hypothetical protein